MATLALAVPAHAKPSKTTLTASHSSAGFRFSSLTLTSGKRHPRASATISARFTGTPRSGDGIAIFVNLDKDSDPELAFATVGTTPYILHATSWTTGSPLKNRKGISAQLVDHGVRIAFDPWVFGKRKTMRVAAAVYHTRANGSKWLEWLRGTKHWSRAIKTLR